MGTDVLPERGCGLCAQAEPLEPRLLLSTIGGGVWEDLDGDGLWDVGEEGLSGWTVYIDVDKNGRRDAGESYQVTGADGGYAFSGLGPGSYWVTEEAPDGWVQSYPDSLSAPRTFTNVNAALPGLYETSIDWGDYDNDGDLDLAVLGKTSDEAVTVIYRNDDMIFTDSGIALPALRNGALAWGDYDNDGWVDLVLTGIEGTIRTAKVYHNDRGSLVLSGAALTDVDNSSAAWGDYDNDGDLDLVVTGFDGTAADTSVYRNDEGVFVDVDAGLPGVHHADAAWGDYDGDGDLDLLLAGRTTDGRTITSVYRNDDGTFTDIAAGLTGVDHCAVAWGDFNGDARGDIVLTGNSSTGRVSIVYRNDGGGVFTDIGADLPGVSGSAVAWGDYNLDGRLDLALTGYGGSEVGRISRVYRNDGGGTFTDAQVGLMGVNGSALAWDDVDGDGYPDIALSGLSGTTSVAPVTQVYRNVALPGPHLVVLGGADVTGAGFGNYRPCTIRGTKWHDLNGDGVWDDGESGLQNWKIYLDANNNGEIDAWEPGALSDAGGDFAFHLLPPGRYIVREVSKAGWMLDVPADGHIQVDLLSGETLLGLAFNGWQPAQIGGSLWDDGNSDGVRDDGEEALAGWTVYLDADGDEEIDAGEPRRTTDAYGAYAFDDLSPGSYVVRVVAEEGWARSAPPEGHYTRATVSGQVDDTAVFGYCMPGAIAGTLWHDEDTDGVRDAEELPLEGWTIFLDADGDGALDAVEPYQITDASGEYTFTGLVPGTHTVAQVIPAGWTPVAPEGGWTTVDVVSKQTTENVDFGNRLPQPEIVVLRDTAEILCGQAEAVEFGSVRQAASAVRVVFTIRNEGDDVMTLGPINVPDGFALSQPPAVTVAAEGGETTFAVDLLTPVAGVKSGPITIVTDDSDESVFRFPVTGTVLTAPEIRVTFDGVEILDGRTEAVDLGQVPQGDQAAAQWTFTVANLGEDVLTVGQVELADGSSFEATAQPGGSVPGGDATTFTLTLEPDTVGTYQADVRFASDDADESPFDFSVTAAVVNAAPIVDAGEDLAGSEGRGVGFAGRFVDVGQGQTHTVEWDFGDGWAEAGSLTPAHVFADDGEYTVTLTVTDSEGGTATDTLTVTVSNLPPTAHDDTGSTAQNTPVTFTGAALAGNDTDVSADPLTVSAVAATGQTHGAVRLIGGDVLYTPAADFYGQASFTYTVDDGDGGTDTATVTVTVSQVDLSLDLVLYLPLNGDAADASGNGHDGTAHGNVSYGDGLFGGAAAFAGAAGDDYIVIDAEIDFPSWESYSVSAWFMDTAAGEYGGGATIIAKGGADAGCSIGVTSTGAVVHSTYGGAGPADLRSDSHHSHDYRDSEWHHVAAVKDGRVAQLYVDDILVDSHTDAETIATAADALVIGCSLLPEASHFGGLIDDVRVYGRALSAAEVGALANHYGPTFPVALDPAGRPVTYVDADGTRVGVYFHGGSAILHFAGGAISRTDGGGGSVVTGTNLRLARIDLADTTLASYLILTAEGGDGLATVGCISGSTPLGLLHGTAIDLIGEGIRMTGEGYVATVHLNDVRNGADIVMPGGGAPRGIILSVDRLMDASDVLLGSHLNVLVASRWGGGRLVTTRAATVLIRGDCGADLTLTGTDANGASLISAVVVGTIAGDWTLAGRAYLIRAAGTADTWTLTAQRNVVRLIVTGDLAGRVSAEYFTGIYASGALSADVVATGADLRGTSIHAMVAAQVRNASLTAAGGVHCINVADWLDTDTVTDTIRAAWIVALITRGRGADPLAGDFNANLILDEADAGGYTLRIASIRGAITGGRWDLAGNAVTVYARRTDDEWQLNTSGSVVLLYGRDGLGGTVAARWIATTMTLGPLRADLTLSGQNTGGTSLGSLVAGFVADVRVRAPGAVGLIHVADWPVGRIEVGAVRALGVVGNFGADLTITGAPAEAGSHALAGAWIGGDLTSGLWDITGDVGNVYIGAAMRGTAQRAATLRATGSIGSLVTGRFEHADILAGIAGNGARHAAVGADFVNTWATIHSIRIAGVAGPPARFLVDTTFSASRFGRLDILNADVSGGMLGLFVRESLDSPEIESLNYRDTVTGEIWYYPASGAQPLGGPAGFIHVIPV